MTERLECEFFLVRYVPDPVRGEFLNIGVVLRRAGEPDKTIARFTRDWSRVLCLHPDADISLLAGLESEMSHHLRESAPDTQPFMTLAQHSFSNAIQVTEGKGCLAESMAGEVDQLMRMYVEARITPVEVGKGRQAVYTAMREQLESVGLWKWMEKPIAASSYTRVGDPLRIDCGLPPNGVRRMFHAVSLEGELETAKALAFSMTEMRKGVRLVEDVDLELTAIVEPLEEVRGGQLRGDRTELYGFAVETMEQQAIRVVTTRDLPRLAKAAREATSAFRRD